MEGLYWINKTTQKLKNTARWIKENHQHFTHPQSSSYRQLLFSLGPLTQNLHFPTIQTSICPSLYQQVQKQGFSCWSVIIRLWICDHSSWLGRLREFHEQIAVHFCWKVIQVPSWNQSTVLWDHGWSCQLKEQSHQGARRNHQVPSKKSPKHHGSWVLRKSHQTFTRKNIHWRQAEDCWTINERSVRSSKKNSWSTVWKEDYFIGNRKRVAEKQVQRV